MARPSIHRIPPVSPKERKAIKATGFETVKQAAAEDAIRAQKLRSSKALGSALICPANAEDLAHRLSRGAESGKPARTLASRRYMWRYRLRFAGALLRFLQGEKHSGFLTVISHKWAVAPEQLMNLCPRKLLRAFRGDLDRSGARASGGWLIVGIDVAFEPERKLFAVHLHGFASAKMQGVIDNLRKRSKYRPIRKETPGCVPIYRPIEIRRSTGDWARACTYVLKSCWNSVWRKPVGADGTFKTAERKHRLPEPYHSLLLLWFDQFNLNDITLMVGMGAGSFGFRRTKPK
ncbi:hypothetical protein [Altericroceibacterium endophyticum]|uniref:Uncharacterized protein n=1 Tax=Altericroceibacterium endophyticum TaxID=1808508 RepID=A0A6I4T849_9SPHN|nr:hypothetical protein [Altericroceibacterium endophyticum]MXO66669.1 hypothetical protein [Altericroceibacterium endophyticum]